MCANMCNTIAPSVPFKPKHIWLTKIVTYKLLQRQQMVYGDSYSVYMAVGDIFECVCDCESECITLPTSWVSFRVCSLSVVKTVSLPPIRFSERLQNSNWRKQWKHTDFFFLCDKAIKLHLYICMFCALAQPLLKYSNKIAFLKYALNAS